MASSLGLSGSRREPGRVAARISRDRSRALHRSRELGVHQQDRTQRGEPPHRRREVSLGDGRELVDPGRHEEALEAEYPGVQERAEVVEIPWHHPAPAAVVDQRAPHRGVCLGGKGRDCGRDGDAVQRHVDDGGHPAGRRRAGRGLKPFPLGASRLVDVDVGVHDAGKECRVARVHPTRGGRRLAQGHHGGDDPILHHHRSRTFALRGHDAPARENEVRESHGQSRYRAAGLGATIPSQRASSVVGYCCRTDSSSNEGLE